MFIFSSVIGVEKKEELERIMFFNKSQRRFESNIVNLVELYGQPSVLEENDQLYITLQRAHCQSLFVTKNDKLVGLFIFNRNPPENINLIHIAVDEKFSSTGIYADEMLVNRMISELKKIALKIRGVETISVKYGRERKFNLKRKKFNAANLYLGFPLSPPSKPPLSPG
jgi:hypothetical protein